MINFRLKRKKYGVNMLKVKISPEYNLPRYVIEALERDDYSYADKDEKTLSVTELIDSPTVSKLSRRNDGVIYVRPSMLTFSLYGTLAHLLLDRNVSTVKKMRVTVDIAHGWKLTGEWDNYEPEEQIIYDNKFIHHRSLNYHKKKNEIQLNLYAYLIKKKYGWNTKKLMNTYWVRSLTERDLENPKYPDELIFTEERRLWSYAEQHLYVTNRLAEYLDDPAKGCNSEERWETERSWCITRKNAESSLKNYTVKKEAAERLLQLRKNGNNKYHIQYRKGEDVRCHRWCTVKDFCQYYKRTYTVVNAFEELMKVK